MHLILSLKFRKELRNQATSQIVWKRLQHQGCCFDWERSGWLSSWQWKQREIFCGNDSGRCRMEFSWSPWDATWICTTNNLGTSQAFAWTLWHRSNVKILALFKDISSGAKQNPVTRNAVVHLIPERRSKSRPNWLSSKNPWRLLCSSCWDF